MVIPGTASLTVFESDSDRDSVDGQLRIRCGNRLGERGSSPAGQRIRDGNRVVGTGVALNDQPIRRRRIPRVHDVRGHAVDIIDLGGHLGEIHVRRDRHVGGCPTVIHGDGARSTTPSVVWEA